MNIDLIILAGGLSSRMGVLKPLLPVGEVPAIQRCIQTGKAAGAREIVVVTGFKHDELERVISGRIINGQNCVFAGTEVGITSGAEVSCVEAIESEAYKVKVFRPELTENEEIRQNAAEPEVRVTHNKDYAEGMFSSVVTGVKALRDGADGFFLLPADCCAVTSDTLIKLASVFADNADNVDNADEDSNANNAGNAEQAVIRPRYRERRGHPPLIPAKYANTLVSYCGDGGLKAVLRTLPTIEVEMDSEETLLDMDTPEDYARLLTFLGSRTYPTTEQCEQLLHEYGATQQIIEHGEQVAALACKVAAFMNEKGAGIDISLLRSACLLHDICRAEPDHARVGMELLLRKGYPKAATLIGEHMELHTQVEVVAERELLYLADKLCRQGRIVAINDTISELKEKFADNDEARENSVMRMMTAGEILDMLTKQYAEPPIF